MPTYTVTVLEGTLDSEKKARIAQEVTRVHSEVTGAPSFFAQVIFSEVKAGNYYIAGKPLGHPQIYLHGQIRAGRSIEIKDVLIKQMVDAIATAADVARTGVWVYLVDLVPRQMVEFGHVLPESGDEPHWTANLPDQDRAWMKALEA
ncbi:4-oxalocrotonate tautomerase family protein [Bradyrhizobium sp. CIR3A]|uniref:tautomerase family protein n=1 Tax=Bradyrhizobium sp. CIR3A TaxID=2663838 RepID=UPI0016062A90|nr:4-oxalocrotonate tautomerase family protein [Bradyrhizobium sp. CIR3A]MBB4261351.1 4-oxalocrotonate tautomerase family enzyme [Bradyrhizobium sp. CIR3A]